MRTWRLHREALLRVLRLHGKGGIPLLVILLSVGSWLLTVWHSGLLDAALEHYGEGPTLLFRDGTPMRLQLGVADQDIRPLAYDRMSPWVVQALVAAEDKRFFLHGGVDILALVRAVGQNIWFRRRISGASTVSTQVIRMAEPRRRTIATKAIEATKAIHMERRRDKVDVLEQYLNRAPFGGNLVGIEAASRTYFDKAAGDLTLAEAALLAGIPQAPARLRPDRHPQAARKRMAYVLDRMAANQMISPEQHAAALRQPLILTRRARPFAAPHFAELLLRQYPTVSGRVVTTLDRDMQALAEQVLQQHVPALQAQGVGNGAVVVLDTASSAVLAMIGSFDYHDAQHAGMVNHALAKRSPGSALKPLVYALAIDQGLITPGTYLDDRPLHFRDGTPQNFDQTFQGNVSVRDALILSLNIPAMRVLAQLGLQEALDGLRELGLSTLQEPAAAYGLGLVLGGCEVTLLELANAYACLAREGQYRPFRLLAKRSSQDAGRQVISAEAAYLVSAMLGGPERSMDLFGHVGDAQLPRFAWKTGTSSGLRDAWTIAWNPRYVVGVWLGDSDGVGCPALVGARVAAPLVADLQRELHRAGDVPWYTPPDGLARRIGQDGLPEGYIPGISVAPAKTQEVVHLQIIMPVSGTIYHLAPHVQLQQSLGLRARMPEPGEPLYWFHNGSFLGIAQNDSPLDWPLRPGTHTFACATANGHQTQTTIEVRTAKVRR